MTVIRATVDNALRVKLYDLPSHVIEQIKDHLTFPNPEMEVAEREGARTSDMDTHIRMFWTQSDTLLLPRGFASRFVRGCAANGIMVNFDDRRVSHPEMELVPKIPERWREHQPPAIVALVAAQQGIYMAPPGSGKTVSMLAVIAKLRQPSIIIVDKSNIARQWQERAYEHFGVELGIFGDGEENFRPITVCLQQTLWSRREELKANGFFHRWGTVVADEVHHWAADTYWQIMALFHAKYRYGASATPDKQNGYYPLVQAHIGEVVHTTPKEILRKQGVLVKPRVEIVHTAFDYPFHGTIVVSENDARVGACPIEGCTKTWKHRHPNNYTKMIAALVDDHERNLLVAKRVLTEPNHTHLVLSARLGHLDALRDTIVGLGYPEDKTFMFTGNESTDERESVQHRAEVGDCVVFSTIADEAVDIPRLDRLHLAFPSKNLGTLEQRIGRIERSHPDKEDAVVVDYVDPLVNVLQKQARERRAFVYATDGLQISDLI